MTICTNCRTEMVCARNGLAAHFGNGHTYMGDEYICPNCEQAVVITVAAPCRLKPEALETMESVNKLVEMSI